MTNTELAVLSLVAEQPMHGPKLERILKDKSYADGGKR